MKKKKGLIEEVSFNSKLVRLKGRGSYPAARARRLSFNSKLVRLKVEISIATPFAIKFQFQTGAIKRSHNWNPRAPCQARFNSKLVRLKVPTQPYRDRVVVFQFQTGAIKRRGDRRCGGGFQKEFQFQTGAIKRGFGAFGEGGSVASFNSKLVRLKAMATVPLAHSLSQFQFQTGAIKSQISPFLRQRWFLFQFQTGAIKSPRHLLSKVRCYHVSIPNWCD